MRWAFLVRVFSLFFHLKNRETNWTHVWLSGSYPVKDLWFLPQIWWGHSMTSATPTTFPLSYSHKALMGGSVGGGVSKSFGDLWQICWRPWLIAWPHGCHLMCAHVLKNADLFSLNVTLVHIHIQMVLDLFSHIQRSGDVGVPRGFI